MIEDFKIIRQLGKKIGSALKQGEFDELLESKQNGYTVDEQGAVTGLCLFKVSLDSLPDTILPFKDLRQLVLSNVNVKAKDFSLLRHMTSLTLLDLSSNGICDISFLSGLKHIAQLYLGSNRIADISPLEDLVHLTTLDLQKNQLTRIGSLETLQSLKIVNLQYNKVSDISPLQGLSRIVYLNITGNSISNIFPLQGMSKIAYLDAANNQIEDISILGRFPGLSYLNLTGNQITDISPIRGLSDLTVLKLTNNSIHSIFSLIELRNLTVLDLGENKLSDLTALSGLTNLVELRLGINEITDLTPLIAITNLTTLVLEDNQITDLTPLNVLTNLKELNLNINKITDLTPLSVLTKLTALVLENNQITDLMPLRSLTNLKKLRLSRNQIEDLTPLTALTHLEELFLYGNQISDISPLSGLIEINHLSLSSNEIINLSPLSTLTLLKILWLSNNNIDDLTPLRALTQLVILGVGINRITDLTPLKELKKLKKLDLRRNQITKLPRDIDRWWSGMEINWVNDSSKEGLNLYRNPLTDPPVEIVKQGKTAVKYYFKEIEIEQASVLFLESKLLLVGSGAVGKTTLMKKLKDNDFKVVPGKEDTTRGVDIQPWQLPCPFPDGISREVKIHFWDFGGQDILHATHQFFLTKRSLYLFVWEPRKEEENWSSNYWLNATKLFGAGSPVIMVMNKADMRVKHIDEASLKDKFPNIAQFLQVSCITGHHIPELTEAIRTTLSGMPHLLDKLPKRWMDIRDELKARNEDYVTREDYFAVCHSHQMDKEKALFLSDYLHDLGIILHFRHDPVLADTVILKPEWATGAVYALIDSLEIQNNKGRFNRAHLGRYWNPNIYPAEKHAQLLRLIEKFELCFNIVGTDDYIIPELLPSQRPAIDMEAYRSTSNLHLHYSYDFLPAGIITRFISRLHYLIREDHYWNNGVELEFSGSSALVVSDSARKRIQVSVSGSNNNQLMGIIRSQFDHIHKKLNMEKEEKKEEKEEEKEEHVFEEVPCICSQCQKSKKPHFFKYDVLQRLSEKGKEARCDKSLDDISPDKLLKGFLPPRIPDNLFDPLIETLSKVQGLKKSMQPDENSRNTVLATLLRARGFRAYDQTLSGSSESGAGIGELDIKIEDEMGRTVSIIEALNLDSLNTTAIDRHVRKLLHNYDCSGLKENYILVYASAKDFEALCRKYREHLEQIDYESYVLKGGIEDVHTGFNKITAYRARHRCNTGETVLYHLLVEM